MLHKLLGRKIGMTQIFDQERNVIPVTVINVADWYVTQVKSQDKDGYGSLQLGMLRKRYAPQEFSLEWLKSKKQHFLHVREVPLPAETDATQYSLGQKITLDDAIFAHDMMVDVSGISKGLGFQGPVKRWGFAGGPKSHGSKFHRRPGSSGNMRRQGEVLKGRRAAGHMGCDKVTVRGLKVVQIDKEAGCIFIKGAVPGHKDSLLVIRKQG
jgi:large subunit ribosomal protein L3